MKLLCPMMGRAHIIILSSDKILSCVMKNLNILTKPQQFLLSHLYRPLNMLNKQNNACRITSNEVICCYMKYKPYTLGHYLHMYVCAMLRI